MYGYIYETTNLVNGKKYIGQHVSSVFDSNYYGSGRAFKKALSYWGKDNFKIKILEECANQDELNRREIYWIDTFRNQFSSDLIYNISDGGIGNNGVKCISEEHRIKIGNANRGRKHSKKSRENMSKGSKGFKWMTHGVISIKVRDYNTEIKYLNLGYTYGRVLSKEWRLNIVRSNYNKKAGKKLSIEHRNKISKANRGKVSSIKGMIAVNNGHIKKYINKDELNLYLSLGYQLGYPKDKRREE